MIFLANKYVGEHFITTAYLAETLDISLGRDKISIFIGNKIIINYLNLHFWVKISLKNLLI